MPVTSESTAVNASTRPSMPTSSMRGALVRREALERRDAPARRASAPSAPPIEREQQALGQQLPDDAHPIGAERAADRDLARARRTRARAAGWRC